MDNHGCELYDLLAGEKAYHDMTVAQIARAMLPDNWNLEVHSSRGRYKVAAYQAWGGSIFSQLDDLASTIFCRAVWNDQDGIKTLAFIEEQNYQMLRDDLPRELPSLPDLSDYPAYPPETDDEAQT